MRTTRSKLPLVSILMTAYNRAEYIKDAIESALSSDYPNLELIVVDDASSDATLSIARRCAKNDPRVKIHVNESNLGDYSNRNRAASLANGKYIKYLDSDDVIYPHGLSVMVDCMERFPEAGFGLSQAMEANRPFPVMLTPAEAYRENFLFNNLFGRAPGSSIINTDAFRDVGGFSGKRQVGDHEFWLKIGRSYSMVKLPRDLVWDRIHGAQEQFADDAIDKVKMHTDIDLAALASSKCPLLPQERRLAFERIERDHAKAVWRYLLRSFSLSKAMEYKRKLSVAWRSLMLFPFDQHSWRIRN